MLKEMYQKGEDMGNKIEIIGIGKNSNIGQEKVEREYMMILVRRQYSI